MKSCDNCYWADKTGGCFFHTDKPPACNDHDYICCECEGEKAEYKYNGKHYCTECILKEFGVEEYIVTHYYKDGEQLGSDDDTEEVISNLNSGIEILE